MKEVKWKQKNPKLHTIAEVVQANTGLSDEELLNDTKEYQIKGMDQVKEKLEEAKKEGTFVTIVGDYDVDGVCSTEILNELLEEMKIPHRIRLPKRHSEGYGLNEKIIDEIEEGILITVDNGIAAIKAIQKAKEKGLYVIILDHHQPVTIDKVDAAGNVMIDEEGNARKEKILPNADIIIDPHAIDGQADFLYYCGAGLAYKLAITCLGKNHRLIPRFNSFAAMATVADVVTLTGDNRNIVKSGLKTILTPQGRTKGLFKLMQVFNIRERITAEDIGFSLGPAINSCGRLGAPIAPEEATQSLKLIAYDGDWDVAENMANEVAGRKLEDGHLSVNESRKQLVKEADKRAEKIIEDNAMYGDTPLVLYVPQVNEGIVGIISGHLTEKYQVPSIVVTDSAKDPNVLKGSGRSVPSVNLKALLDACADDMVGYGGHPGAAGLSVRKDHLDIFRNHLQEKLEELGTFSYEEKELTYDLEIQEADIENLIPELDKYGPYGNGNEQPVFLIRNFKLYPKGTQMFSISGSDNEHITFYGACTKMNAFWLHEKYVEIGEPKYLNLIGTLSEDHFNGKVTYGMKVLDMEAAEEPKKTRTLLAQKFKERTNNNEERKTKR